MPGARGVNRTRSVLACLALLTHPHRQPPCLRAEATCLRATCQEQCAGSLRTDLQSQARDPAVAQRKALAVWHSRPFFFFVDSREHLRETLKCFWARARVPHPPFTSEACKTLKEKVTFRGRGRPRTRCSLARSTHLALGTWHFILHTSYLTRPTHYFIIQTSCSILQT